MEELVLFSRKKQERAANHYSSHTGPDRDVDRLLVLYRQLDRAQLGLMSALGVAETTVHQPKHAGNDKHNGQNLDPIHLVLLSVNPSPGPARVQMVTQILTVTVGIDLYSAVQVDRASPPADQPFPAPRA
jgi:hypothetical protein